MRALGGRVRTFLVTAGTTGWGGKGPVKTLKSRGSWWRETFVLGHSGIACEFSCYYRHVFTCFSYPIHGLRLISTYSSFSIKKHINHSRSVNPFLLSRKIQTMDFIIGCHRFPMSHNYILLSASALSDIYICNYPGQLLMLNLFCFVLGEGIFEEIKIFFFFKKNFATRSLSTQFSFSYEIIILQSEPEPFYK